MHWRIKWRFSDAGPRTQVSEPLVTREIAIVSACPILALQPYEIWIEGPQGERIDSAEIAQVCQQYGPFDHASIQDGADPHEQQPDKGPIPHKQAASCESSGEADTVAILQEETSRLLHLAKATADLRSTRRLHRRAFDLARLAELMKLMDQLAPEGPVPPDSPLSGERDRRDQD
jgi:hypothetical protein